MTIDDVIFLFAKPSPAARARRQALFAQVMVRRRQRGIRLLTSTGLVHLARTDEGSTDDPRTDSPSY